MKAYQEYKKLQTIAATRVRLGLSQEVFAMELGISRSLVSKAENKNRSLPTAALVKLAALEITMAGKASVALMKQQPAAIMDESHRRHAKAEYTFKENYCRLNAERLQCLLTLMKARYAQISRSLVQVELMIGAEGAGCERYLPGYLEMHRYSLLRKLSRCSLPMQASLTHKIALEHAAAELHAVNAKLMED